MDMNDEITVDKLRDLEEKSNQISEDIAIYQNICVDQLCMEYSDQIVSIDEREEVLRLLYRLAHKIHNIYFD